MLEKGINFVGETIVVSGCKDRVLDFSGCTAVGGELVKEPSEITDHGLKLLPGAKLYSAKVSRELIGISNGAIKHSELYINGKRGRLSCYPHNGEFLKITGFPVPKTTEWGDTVGEYSGGFYYDDPRPREWENIKGLSVYGYWCYDWSSTYDKVEQICGGLIKRCPPFPKTNWGYRKGNRFRFVNVYDELHEVGDYYINTERSEIVFVCGEDDAEIFVSTLSTPLIRFEDCENITLRGLKCESTCAEGIEIENCTDFTVEDCYFANIGGTAVCAVNTKGLKVANCLIHDCGSCGIDVTAGNRETLESGETLIEGNHVYRVGQWRQNYFCPVNVTGVGFTVRNNLLHDCPHTAVLFWGNEIHILNNEIYSVVMSTGDAGAVYTGRDYSFRGNVVSRNYIHHLGGVGMGAMGIYNDDCVSGTLMEGNVFCEVSRAVFLGGGRDYKAHDNLFINCYPSVSIDDRGADGYPLWVEMVNDTMRKRYYDVGADGGVYAERYPELARIDEFYKSGDEVLIPQESEVSNSLYCSERKLESLLKHEDSVVRQDNNKSIDKDCFVDFTMGVYDLKEPLNKAVRLCEVGPKEQSIYVLSGFEGDELLLKNVGKDRAEGEYTVYGKDFVGQSVSFALEPGESGRYPLERYDFEIEVRSSLPGARPARRH